MRIVVIGAGHAGEEAAHTAAATGATVTLLSSESELPCFRPRLVACAFGQIQPESIAIHPEAWYRERSITLHRQTPATMLQGHRSVRQGNQRSMKQTVVWSDRIGARAASEVIE